MNRLKQLRKSRKMKQTELADLIGVSNKTISHWEKGRRKIKSDKLGQLADLFDVSIPYLLGYDTDDKFSDLITRINQWADDRNLKQADPKIQWMRVTEEVGEIRDVLLKPTKFTEPQAALKDAIGDTLVTGDSQGVVEPSFRIRKLTPRECWRLQGFPDWAFDKAQEVNSNSQLYKQAGNSVTVNVIEEIARRL